MNKGLLTKKDMYEALTQSISNAKNNPNALVTAMPSEDDYLSADYLSSPLSAFDCAPISDGASAMIIGTEEAAEKLGLQKIKISSAHHSIESSNFGARDLSTSESIIGLGKKINLKSFKLDFAELHTQFTYEIPFIRGLLDLGNVDINLSGGPLAGNVMMAAGLDSIGKSFELLKNSDFHNGLAHASSGPCLQQNMLVHLEKIND
jgi:acetyl-CoA acetyltransferase